MRHRHSLIMAALIVLCSVSAGFSIPQMINYQGILLDSNGDPVTTTTSVVFAIWNEPSLGDSLWSETQSVTPDTLGRFNVLLGSVSTIPDTALAGDAYVSVKVDVDPEMAPRTLLVAVPYAYRVHSVEGADGGELRGSLFFSDSMATFWEEPMAYLFGAPPASPTTRPIFARSPVEKDLALVYNTSNESFEFKLGGSAMTIEMSTHRVGIGTSSPDAELDVVGVLKAQVAELGVNTTRSGFQSTVGGGGLNSATANWATTAGGQLNTSSGQYATSSGGFTNAASGNYSIIPGGQECDATGDHSMAAGRRAQAIHNGAFVWADQTNADFFSERDNQFRVRASGGFRVDDDTMWVDIRDDGTDFITTSNGAHLSLGGVWSNASDRNLKEDFRPIEASMLLEKLVALPITEWKYKTENGEARHIGPTAQGFHRVFELGGDDKSISTIDPSGIALATIQELYRRNQALESQLAELRQMIETVRSESDGGR